MPDSIGAIIQNVDLGGVLHEWMNDYYWVTRLLFATAYLMGIGFMVRALYYLKVYGEARTMMASQSNFLTPVAMIICGACLIFLPTAIDVLNYTLYDTNDILSYQGAVNPYQDFIVVAGLIVKLIGFIAVIRGFVMLAGTGKQGAQPQTAKAITHLIGGVMAINFWASVSIFSNLFGIFWF